MGKKTEKEKIYHEGCLNFVGEFTNGLKNGKGQTYDNKGKLIYEDEFVNDTPQYYYEE